MAEKDFEKDVTIGKVYKGKGGESQHGPWQIWNFYLDDPDDKRKFTWFEKDGLIPIEGMSVKAMEFEVSETHKDGKAYLNHTVKWFKLNSTPNTPQKSTQSAPASTGGTIRLEGLSFYVSYAKDLMVGLMGSHPAGFTDVDLEDLGDIVMAVGKRMCKSAMELPEPEKEPYKPTLGPGDDYPPIGDPPPF